MMKLQLLMLLLTQIESLKIMNPNDIAIEPEVNPLEMKKADSQVAFGNFELSAAEFNTMKKNFKPKLNNMHMKAPGEKKPVLFIHVHKSLGTWACAAFRHAGGVAPQGGDCSLLEDTPWHQKDFEYFDKENTCDARTQMANTNGWKFEEIERNIEFEGGDICPASMSTAVIFRNPVDRIKSQMMANHHQWAQISDWLRYGTSDLEHAHSWFQSHVGYDNFYIRSFIGRDFFLGTGKITRQHLEKAKQNLAKVDAVIDAADLLTQVVQLEALTGLEMQQMSSTQVHNDGCVPYNDGTLKPECKSYVLPAEAEQQLKNINALDQEFYEYAQQLAKEKTEKFGVHS